MATGAAYTQQNQNLVIAGAPMSFGRAPGTWCDMQWVDPDEIKMFMGPSGLGMFVRSDNRAAIVTLTILVNAPENDILNALYIAADQAPNGLRYPVMVQQGLTLYTGLGMIMGRPAVSMTDAAMTNTWRFACTSMVGTTGSLPGAPLP